MTDEQRKYVEELKTMVLELHRSAGQLDNLIQTLEMNDTTSNDGSNIHENEYMNVLVKTLINSRFEGFGDINLPSKEIASWDGLLSTFKKDWVSNDSFFYAKFTCHIMKNINNVCEGGNKYGRI